MSEVTIIIPAADNEVDVTIEEQAPVAVTISPAAAVQVMVQPVGATGPQGPAGVAGSNGMNGLNGGNYTHVQVAPASVWNISHNLGYKPNILIENSAHDTVIGQIEYIDNNNAIVTFSAAFAGEAYCS